MSIENESFKRDAAKLKTVDVKMSVLKALNDNYPDFEASLNFHAELSLRRPDDPEYY